jgi:hypothetical protein
MRAFKTAPKPILQKLIYTLLAGAFCFIVGDAFYLYAHDETAFILSAIVLAANVIQAFELYRVISKGRYETVEGACAAISAAPLRKTHEVKIIDGNGVETTLRLGKQTKLQIGSGYRFYFAIRDTAPPLERLDAARLLGYEQTDKP